MWRILVLVAAGVTIAAVDQFILIPLHAIVFGAIALVLFAGEYFIFRRSHARDIILGACAILLTLVFYLLASAAITAVFPGIESWARFVLFFGIAYLVFGASVAISPEVGRFVARLSGKDTAKEAKIVDTSVIIDGRIAVIAETGFIEGTLVVPAFVVKELQYLSDSADPQKRIRGRRGLDILNKMKLSKKVPVLISDIDYPNIREVDLKLLELAKALKGKVITNDYNLNKVASIHDVEVLNLNDLATMVRSDVQSGDVIKIELIREGTDKNQAVGHLEDGTMVVVENADRSIGKTVDVRVQTVRQTSAGRMLFGELNHAGGGGRPFRGRR